MEEVIGAEAQAAAVAVIAGMDIVTGMCAHRVVLTPNRYSKVVTCCIETTTAFMGEAVMTGAAVAVAEATVAAAAGQAAGPEGHKGIS